MFGTTGTTVRFACGARTSCQFPPRVVRRIILESSFADALPGSNFRSGHFSSSGSSLGNPYGEGSILRRDMHFAMAMVLLDS
jgi:hypothetical protein